LHIFAQHVYDKILYVDSDCLVQKDVSHLLNIDIGMISDTNNSSSSPRKGGLIAAAPDIFPPDKFNAGVMLLQPSLPLFHDLMTQSQSLTTYDGGDTGFLNAYFDDWHSYPTERRLGFQYNAQRFMHQCTYEKQPKYWDVAVGDIFVIHFSSSPKPWESSVASASSKDGKVESASSQSDLLTKEEAAKIQQCESKSKALDKLWHKAYKKSMRFKEDYEEEQKLKTMQKVLPMKNKTLPVKKRSNAQSPATSQAAKKKQSSMSFQKRYKQLRKEEGMDSREAMKKARSEFGYDRDEKVSAGKQVAQMFGMPL
jgi:lipopolysaccharide biosynthesis glycosyltransferase